MSWNFRGAGKPEDVCKKIDEGAKSYGEGTQSRKEYDEASVGLKSLIMQNAGPYIVEVDAFGSQSVTSEGAVVSGQCQVTIRPIYVG